MTNKMDETVKQNKNGTEAPKVVEPSENDPCIEFKSSSGKVKFWKDAELRLREKSGLSRVGLYVAIALILLLIILFITVVVLAATWPRRLHHELFPVCSDPACLRAAAKVQDSLNATVPPCKDVWTWACGRWLVNNPLPVDRSVWSIWKQLEVQEAARVRDLVTTLPLPLHTGTVEWKLKHFYESCLEVDNVNADQARPLTTIISELGGWYVTRDWNMADFDANYVLKQLHVKYGVSPYFKVSVEPNPRQPGHNTITISPSGLGLPDRAYYYTNLNDPIQIAYKQLIRDVVIHLSVTKTDAEKFGEDMFYYEKRIAEITPDSYEMRNAVNTYNPIKISELKLTAPSLPLQDILTAMYPEATVTEETEVIVKSPDYLTKVSQIAATTDRMTLNSYIIWTLARKYLPYLSFQLTSTVDSFKSELLGIRAPIPRWEKCARLVQNFMGLAVESAFESQNSISNQTLTVVGNIFQQIRKTLKDRLKNYQVSAQLQRHLSNKINTLKLQIGLPAVTRRENYLKKYYNKLIILKANLFESYKNSLIFQKKVEEQILISPNAPDKLIYYATNYPYKVSYLSALNTVIVPRALLTPLLYEDEFPSSVLYGRLGIEIANSIVSSILPHNSAWDSDLKLLSPFHYIVNESLESVSATRNCLSSFIAVKQLTSLNNAELTSLSALKHISAISLAYQALWSSLEGQNHVHQPSLEKLEEAALFFLTYTQSQCSVTTKQQELFDNIVNHELTQKSQFEVAWNHLAEFAESLECDENTKRCKNIF